MYTKDWEAPLMGRSATRSRSSLAETISAVMLKRWRRSLRHFSKHRRAYDQQPACRVARLNLFPYVRRLNGLAEADFVGDEHSPYWGLDECMTGLN